MRPTDQTPPGLAPEIFILGDKFEVDLWGSFLTRKGGYRVRSFGGEAEVPRLIEELREARSRPALLIVRGMRDLLGLQAAKACRDIEPGLKVLVVTTRWDLSVLAKSPVVIDEVILPHDLSKLGETVDRLMSAPRRATTDLASRLLAQKQAATKLLVHHSQGQPPRAPEIFILADDKLEAVKWGRLLALCDYISRGFGPDEIPRMFEELREARPTLLVARTLGDGCPGLVAAKTCREMEPGLKVLLAGEGTEESPPAIPANCPVAVDGTIGVPTGFIEFGCAVHDLIGSARPGPIGPTIPSGRIQP